MILYYCYTLIILSIFPLSLWEIHCHWAPNVSHHPQAPKITSGLEALLIQKRDFVHHAVGIFHYKLCGFVSVDNRLEESLNTLCLRHKRLHSFPVITLKCNQSIFWDMHSVALLLFCFQDLVSIRLTEYFWLSPISNRCSTQIRGTSEFLSEMVNLINYSK